MKLVSACLAGLNVRFDASNKANQKIIALVEAGEAIPVCPEQLSGLKTPRNQAEIIGGQGETVLENNNIVRTIKGEDVTESFVRGAKETLRSGELWRDDASGGVSMSD